MEYRQLGNSSLNISRISFGCMSLKNAYAEKERILLKAVDEGINFFDTADLYDKGLNEAEVGKALKNVRNQIIIATKVGNQWREDGSGWDWTPAKDYILSSVEKSLKRLGTDYIDLYQLHGGTIDDPIDETIEAFELLKEQGKIRHYGISSIRPNVIREFIKKSGIVSVMMQYSLLDRRPEEECLPLLLKNEIGVLVRGSVAQGLLIDKPAKPYLNYNENEVKKAADIIKKASSRLRTNTQMAIQFVLKNSAVTTAVVGIRTDEQLIEAVNTVKAPPFSETEFEALSSAVEKNVYEQHR